MTRVRGIFLAAVAAALVSASGTEALAVFGDFNYTSTVAIPAGGVQGPTAVVNPAGTGITITLTALGETGLNAAQAGTDIVFGNIGVSSTSAVDQNIGSITYRFVLTITNTNNGSTAPVTINGTLTGTARSNGANIENLYTAPTQSQAVTTGAIYVVDTGPGSGTYTAPSTQRLGTFGAHVTAVPEPTSIALLGMGVVGLIGLSRRRRS